MAEAKTENAVRVTLSSGKVVMLREMKIKHQTLASRAAGSKPGVGENSLLMGTLMQQELMKILLINIDGVVPSATERESLDDLLTFAEYQQLSKVVGKLMGGEPGECPTEIVSIGKP